MQYDDPFRITSLVIGGLTTAMMAYHRIQAAKSSERISHKEEGLLFATVLRLCGLCMALGTLAYLVDPVWMQWASLTMPAWLRWSGSIVSVLCFGLMFWTLTNLGKKIDGHRSDQSQRHAGDNWPVPLRSPSVLCEHRLNRPFSEQYAAIASGMATMLRCFFEELAARL